MSLPLSIHEALAVAPTIPISFHGNRWTYAWALFSLLLTCSLSLTAMVQSMRNAWMQRTISAWRDPINVNRYVIWLLLTTILIGGGPDVVVMLAYGEVKPQSIALMLVFDRIMDGMTMFPVVAAILLWYRGKPVINYQLIRQPIPVDLWPKLRQMVPHIRIGVIVAIISLGVALGK